MKPYPSPKHELSAHIRQLIQDHQPGFSLQQPFYTEPDIFQFDLEKIWMKFWLYAGHTSQIPDPGSFFLYQVGEESVIVMRDEDGKVHALINVCRHRGSQILTEECGKAKKLVCPYHQWVYDQDGTLRAAKMMPDDFHREEYGLFRIHCQVLEGFIFISFAENPFDFSHLVDIYTPHLAMYQIGKTKICFTKKYLLKANWKLLVENFRECYHCGVGHPEYCNVIIGANLTKSSEQFNQVRQDKLKQWEAMGIPIYREMFEPDVWAYCERYPYQPGFVTQSLDGQPVAPILGKLPHRDVGVFSIVQYPNFWLDVNNDYIWTMRVTPISATELEAEATWLVHEDADEGVDFKVDEVIAFWRTTAEQDWKLIEDNQSGVNSKFYLPGPYAAVEGGPDQFVNWYLEQLSTD